MIASGKASRIRFAGLGAQSAHISERISSRTPRYPRESARGRILENRTQGRNFLQICGLKRVKAGFALVCVLCASAVDSAEVRWMRVTAYCPCQRCCGPHACGITATGRRAVGQIVAVDPRCIRLGGMLHVPGHGWNVAADTGRVIKGPARLDLLKPDHESARRFGVRWMAVTIMTRAEWARAQEAERFEARCRELIAAGRWLAMTAPGVK